MEANQYRAKGLNSVKLLATSVRTEFRCVLEDHGIPAHITIQPCTVHRGWCRVEEFHTTVTRSPIRERPVDMLSGGVKYHQGMHPFSSRYNSAHSPGLPQQPARVCSTVGSQPTGQQFNSWGNQYRPQVQGQQYISRISVRRIIPRSSQQEQDPAYKYSDGVNRFLGNFLPSSSFAREELSVDFNVPKLKGVNLTQLAKMVEEGLARTQWFVTGEVDARLFSNSFAFKDESVATTGIKAYAVGVRKLFDQVRRRCSPHAQGCSIDHGQQA